MWPALGATAALFICVFTATTVHRASRGGVPESIANTIAAVARESADRRPQLASLSSYYPVPLDGLILAPRPLHNTPALDSLSVNEAVFALSAVVTREGRVANYELLQSGRAGRRPRHGGDHTHSAGVKAMLDAVKRSRFEPAQGADGEAVTVRVVWILARTTVRAEADDAVKARIIDGVVRPAPRPARS
jgi:hypothetical protein